MLDDYVSVENSNVLVSSALFNLNNKLFYNMSMISMCTIVDGVSTTCSLYMYIEAFSRLWSALRS